MQNQERESKFKRFKSKLKGRETSSQPASATSSQDNQASPTVNIDYNDRQQVEKRYNEAVNQLREAIKIRKGSWGSFDLEGIIDEPERHDDSLFKNKINAVLMSREASVKDKNGWSKFKYAVECIFTAFSPLVKNVLLATKDAQSVVPISPFCVLIVM